MIELTPSARMRLNDYLDELRRVLAGSPSVDPADVERDVRDHIDTALAHYTPPVEEPVLDNVLKELGSPAQWLPGEERPWYRKSRAEVFSLAKRRVVRFLNFVTAGPESYRLAYLSLLVLALGWCILGVVHNDDVFLFVIIATLVSFILSRAALSLFGAEQLSSGQKWLLYPALLVVYVPLALALFFGMAAMSSALAFVAVEENHRDQRHLQNDIHHLERIIDPQKQTPEGFAENLVRPHGADLKSWSDALERKQKLETALANLQSSPASRLAALPSIVVVCGVIALAGVNWLLVGLLVVLFPGVFRNVFHPFAERLTRWPGYGLAMIGLLMSLGGLAFIS